MALTLTDQYRLATADDGFTGRMVSAINGAASNAITSSPLAEPNDQASRMALVAVCLRDPLTYVLPFKYATLAMTDLTAPTVLDDDTELQTRVNSLFDVLALRLTPTVAA